MNEPTALLYNSLLTGGLLFVLGAIGFLLRRNMIVMFLSVEMMLQGVSISLIAWGRYHGGALGGQMLVLFIIAVAAAEAGLALALVMMLFHQSGSLDVVFWQDLREEGQPPHIDLEVPEEPAEDQVWPELTPAGVEPEVNQEEHMHRRRV